MNFFDDEKIEIDPTGMALMEKVKELVALDKDVPDRDARIDSAMTEMYNYFISSYSEETIEKFDFQLQMFGIEQLLSKEFLPLESKPIYDSESQVSFPTSIKTEEDIKQAMEYVVHRTRKMLSKEHDLENDSLAHECFNTSIKVRELCEELGISNTSLELNQDLGSGLFHCFDIASLTTESGMTKSYLIDCTYRQFFKRSDSNINRISVMRGPAKGCSVGSYMMMSPERTKIAEELLTKGYIEATPEVLKNYFDAIIFSGRSSKFYEENGLDYHNPQDCIPMYTLEGYYMPKIEEYLKYYRKNSTIISEILKAKKEPVTISDINIINNEKGNVRDDK